LNRKYFLKTGALASLGLLSNQLLSNGLQSFDNNLITQDDLLKRLITENDTQVSKLLQSIQVDKVSFSRKIGNDFSMLAASYCSKGSKYYQNPLLVSKIEILIQVLKRFQTEDGTMNFGNLESPPDTAFLVELLGAGAKILKRDKSSALTKVNEEIKIFLLQSANALVTGGVHTPNHRWVISAALAKVNDLYPNPRFVNRIEEWLSEGVFNDHEGHYPERSGIYSRVENTAFITIAHLMDKQELLVPVRKNLNLLYYYIEPNGDLVTTDSRRQDQYQQLSITPYYLNYRYMAIKDNNSDFAAVTKYIESLPSFEKEIVQQALFYFLEEPILQQDLPAPKPLLTDYKKLVTTSHLLRIRRDQTSVTLFGGVDWPLVIGSGRSNSPNFFSYRKGQAILKYVRLSSAFFSMGYFYSEGIKKEDNGYLLSKNLEVPYYQPLPENLRKEDGDYKLSQSIDGRFWNKMSFEERPVSNLKTLKTNVLLNENNGTCELQFDVTGLVGVPVTIELCFNENGKLSGTSTAENDLQFLENGFGKFEHNGDTIDFGPGVVAHRTIKDLAGERYSTHFGSLKTNGKHVYITGVTPFSHKLTFS
jgi:hypothetical protein